MQYGHPGDLSSPANKKDSMRNKKIFPASAFDYETWINIIKDISHIFAKKCDKTLENSCNFYHFPKKHGNYFPSVL